MRKIFVPFGIASTPKFESVFNVAITRSAVSTLLRKRCSKPVR
jgi:hypothetical protein